MVRRKADPAAHQLAGGEPRSQRRGKSHCIPPVPRLLTVKDYREKHAEDEPPLQISERARLRELERENRELKMKCEFLSKAAAYFAAEHR